MWPLKIGVFKLWPIQTGLFRLDGGAMFGVVPKNLWSRKLEPDDQNRIPMGMRSLLIQSEKTRRLYLVDNGAGTKFNAKMAEIYGVDYREGDLDSSLAKAGFKTDDITDVIFTHLHFDHCGGTTRWGADGKPELVFPKARMWITQKHLETALNPNLREKASFFPENIDPISNSPNLTQIDEGFEYELGLTNIIVNGHTAGMQLPKITGDGKTVVFAADLYPTAAHLPTPWAMGYDMCVLTTIQEREIFMEEAVPGGWMLFLEHDAHITLIKVHHDGKNYGVKDVLA